MAEQQDIADTVNAEVSAEAAAKDMTADTMSAEASAEVSAEAAAKDATAEAGELAEDKAEEKAEDKAEEKADEKAEDKADKDAAEDPGAQEGNDADAESIAKKSVESTATGKAAAPVKKQHKLDASWQSGATAGQARLELTPDVSRALLHAPTVDGKGPFMPPWQLVAAASGAKAEILPAAAGQRAQLVITSPSAQRLERAKKYVRLLVTSDHCWARVDSKADDDEDTSFLICPEDLWSWVLGKQDSNLLLAQDDFGVLIFIMGKRRKLGEVAQSKINTDAEPIFQLAIMGELHGRCSAQLRFMSAVDWKRPGYNSKLNFSIPSNVDWIHQAIELPKDDVSKCIGTKGSIKRALCQSAESVIDYLGCIAHVCGPSANCKFAIKLIEILRTSKKKEIEGIPEGVEDFCDAINVPKMVVPHLAGRNRKELDQIEELEGVMIFLFKPPDDEDEDDAGADDTSAVFVFALSLRSRQRALLRLDKAVSQRCAGFATRDLEVSEEPGVSEDVIELESSSVSRLSEHGARRKNLERASGCAIEYIGQCVHFVGDLEERTRGKQYLDWLVLQESGERSKSRAVPISSSEVEQRTDLTRMVLTNAEHEKLMAGGRQAIDVIEAASGTLMLFQEASAQELLRAGNRGDFVVAGRRFVLEIVKEPADMKGEMTLRLCAEGETGPVAGSGASITLLIFSRDEGMAGNSGRALAAKKVTDFLVNPSAQQAVMEEARATAADTLDNDWEPEPNNKPASASANKRNPKKEVGRPSNWGSQQPVAPARSSQPDAKQDVWAKWNNNNSSDRKNATQEYSSWGDNKQAKSNDQDDGWGNWKGSTKNDDWKSGSSWQW